ncbi:MAG: Crp/Fnr family transcriptional regulator [Anaerolineales bacterium]|jgi:CRP/FNR family transcriptional regulator
MDDEANTIAAHSPMKADGKIGQIKLELFEHLENLFSFEGVDEEILKELSKDIVSLTFEKGEHVFWEGDASQGLYILDDGWLKIYKMSEDGREQVIRFVGPGEGFHEIGVFIDRPNPVSVVALEAARVWLLETKTIMKMLREKPEIALRVVSNMAERIVYLVSLVTDLSLRSVMARLARLLLADSTDGILERPSWYTQTELAARLGTVSDVINRVLRELEAKGIIEVERQQITIIDHKKLKEMAEM